MGLYQCKEGSFSTSSETRTAAVATTAMETAAVLLTAAEQYNCHKAAHCIWLVKGRTMPPYLRCAASLCGVKLLTSWPLMHLKET